MSVFALFFALLADQFRPLRRQHRIYALLRRAAFRVQRHLDTGGQPQAKVVWALIVLGPAIASWLVWLLLHWLFGGFFAFLWSVAVLYAALEFRSFGLYFTHVRNAFNIGDGVGAANALSAWRHDLGDNPQQYITADDALACTLHTSLVHIHRYVFGVFSAFLLLSFIGLGPMGAVLFRTAEYVNRHWLELQHRRDLPSRASPALACMAGQGWRIVNWVPARISGWMFAAVGRSEDALMAWRNHSSDKSHAGAADEGDSLVKAMACAAMGLPGAMTAQVLGIRAGEPFFADTQQSCGAAEQAPVLLSSVATMIWRVLLLWVVIWLVLALINAVV